VAHHATVNKNASAMLSNLLHVTKTNPP
jgi:hypothetical protein